MAHSSEAKTERLVIALASGKTVAEAAAEAGVSVRTVFRRLEDPAFCALVSQARAEMFSAAVGALAALGVKAVGTLDKMQDAENESVRVSAARYILEIGNRLRENVELEKRIAELEKRIGGSK